MNLFDSSFLCLDIGTSGVRGMAHRVKSGRISQSAIYSVDGTDTVLALKTVIDELETQIGAHFDSAYITGNFGESHYTRNKKTETWDSAHKITKSDIQSQISHLDIPRDYSPMHIIPLRYDLAQESNVDKPVGGITTRLTSFISAICYPNDRLSEITGALHHAHIQADAFFDPQFLFDATNRTDKDRDTYLYLDLGAEFTSASIWTWRGPVVHFKIKPGLTDIIHRISTELQIDFNEAARITRHVASLNTHDMDRFTPADNAYEFSRADINDIVLPMFVDIASEIKSKLASTMAIYAPQHIILSGGGSEIDGVKTFFENIFSAPTTATSATASVRALSDYIWGLENAHCMAYAARRDRWQKRTNRILRIFKRKKKTKRPKVLPILPSSLVFKMDSPSTYQMFQSAGISIIHVDIMDGLYVDNIAGDAEYIQNIRNHTNAHLHVHLMTDAPVAWATDAIAAGANTVILSTNTSGFRQALEIIRNAGRRCGVALNPESKVSLLEEILPQIDEVMVMAVAPGAAGQSFNMSAVNKIRELATIRRARGLKFLISVDGGINNQTAQLCWAAGANMLVSGSYLANSADFPLAVQSLLPQRTE